MRRAIRIDRTVDLLRSRAAANTASPYICSSCSYQTSSFSTSSSRPADKKIPFTEKVRRKIWGTDQPPGLEDPYSNATVLDRTEKMGQEQEMAPRSALPVAELDPSYVPAATWDGLESVGGFGRWWKEKWDPDHGFEGFLPRDTTTDQNAIVDALRRAIVEVFALREAGMSLSEVSKTISMWDPTEHVQILPSTAGATLQFSQEVTLDMVIQSLSPATDETDETAVKGNPSESEAEVAADRSSVDPLQPEQSAEVDETAVKGNPSESEADVAADRSTVDPLHREMPHGVDETAAKGNPSESEANVAADRSTVDPNASNKSSEHSSRAGPISPKTYADAIEPRDAPWLEISLENPEVKFAVLKRMMQLTGIRIQDPVIRSLNTAQALLQHLIAPPKPRKVIEALKQKADLAELPNVTVYGRRRTPVDKERSLGRWKVIETELRERGLPVYGRDELKGAGLPIFSRNR